jgi:hypothetical protein
VNKTIGTNNNKNGINYILKFKMVEYIMKKEICGTFHLKYGIGPAAKGGTGGHPKHT